MTNGHGGKRPGQGRPSKAKEEQVRKLGLDAIKKVYGSIEAYYEFIAVESKDSFPHLKLLQEYVFGKPKEIIEVVNESEDFIDYSKLSVKALREIANASISKHNES
jgi:hypothetical protein